MPPINLYISKFIPSTPTSEFCASYTLICIESVLVFLAFLRFTYTTLFSILLNTPLIDDGLYVIVPLLFSIVIYLSEVVIAYPVGAPSCINVNLIIPKPNRLLNTILPFAFDVCASVT